MLVYEYKTSKAGKSYPVCYYQFKSGKMYKLSLPFPVIRGLIRNGIAKEITNGN